MAEMRLSDLEQLHKELVGLLKPEYLDGSAIFGRKELSEEVIRLRKSKDGRVQKLLEKFE